VTRSATVGWFGSDDIVDAVSIYSTAREGVALANRIVASQFDVTSAAVFAVCSAHGSHGVPMALLSTLVKEQRESKRDRNRTHIDVEARVEEEAISIDRAVARLWRHGLVEYQQLALPSSVNDANDKKPTAAAAAAAAVAAPGEDLSQLRRLRDGDAAEARDGQQRELHVLVAHADVALWRVRALGQLSILQRVRRHDAAQAIGICEQLMSYGCLSYDDLVRGGPDGCADALPDEEQMDRRSLVAQLFDLGFIIERLPMDVEAKRRHAVHAYSCAQAPKARLEKQEEKSKAPAKRKAPTASAASSSSSAAGAVSGKSTSKKQQVVEKGAQVAEKSRLSSFVDAVRKVPLPIPPEPAIHATGAGLADDAALPEWLLEKQDLPEPLQRYRESAQQLRKPLKKAKRPEERVDNIQEMLLNMSKQRAAGQFESVAALDESGRPRACELQLCVDPLALTLAARLEVYFDYLAEQVPTAKAVIGAAFMLALTGGSVRLFAAELRCAGLVSRERPCVLRRVPLLMPIAIDVLAAEMNVKQQDALTALQDLRDCRFVTVDGNQVKFNMRRVQTEMFDCTVDAHVHRRYGANARRVFALLRANPNILEADVQLRALLSVKETRHAIGELLAADWLRFTEFNKTAEVQPARAIYAWAVPHGEHQRALIRDRAHATLQRMLTRLEAEHERLELDNVLRAGIDVRGSAPLKSFRPPVAPSGGGGGGGDDDDDDDEVDNELLENRRHLLECGKWLSRVHKQTYVMLTKLFEKLECIECNVNFS
jgi:hypothetical protein